MSYSVRASSPQFFRELANELRPASKYPSNFLFVRAKDGSFSLEAKTRGCFAEILRAFRAKRGTSFCFRQNVAELRSLVAERLYAAEEPNDLTDEQRKELAAELLAARSVERRMAKMYQHYVQRTSLQVHELRPIGHDCLEAAAKLMRVSLIELLCVMGESQNAYERVKAQLEPNFAAVKQTYIPELLKHAFRDLSADGLRLGYLLVKSLPDPLVLERGERGRWLEAALFFRDETTCYRIVAGMDEVQALVTRHEGEPCLFKAALCSLQYTRVIQLLQEKGETPHCLACAIHVQDLVAIQQFLDGGAAATPEQLEQIESQRQQAFRRQMQAAFQTLDHALVVQDQKIAVNREGMKLLSRTFDAMLRGGNELSITELPSAKVQAVQDCLGATLGSYSIEQEESVTRLVELALQAEMLGIERLGRITARRVAMLYQNQNAKDLLHLLATKASYSMAKECFDNLQALGKLDEAATCAYAELLLSGGSGVESAPQLAKALIEEYLASNEPTDNLVLTLAHILQQEGDDTSCRLFLRKETLVERDAANTFYEENRS